MENNKSSILSKILLTSFATLTLVSLGSTSMAELVETEIPGTNGTEVYLTDDSGRAAYDKAKTYMLDIDSIGDDEYYPNDQVKQEAQQNGRARFHRLVYTTDSYEGGIFKTHTSLSGEARLIPQNIYYRMRGLIPQYLPEGFYIDDNAATGTSTWTSESADYRYAYMQKNRWNLSTKEWNAYAGGGVMYCAAYNETIRFGSYDDKVYYFPVNHADSISNSGYIRASGEVSLSSSKEIILTQIKTAIKNYFKRYYDNGSAIQYYPSTSYPYSSVSDALNSKVSYDGSTADLSQISYNIQYLGLPTPSEDYVGYIILSHPNGGGTNSFEYRFTQGLNVPSSVYPDNDEWISKAELSAYRVIDSHYNSRAGEEYSDVPVINKEGVETSSSGVVGRLDDVIHGTDIYVLENEESEGYKKTTEDDFENNKYSYIFSAIENAYGMPEYAKKYSLEDIQSAYWLLLHDEVGKKDPSDTITANGEELARIAQKYETFVDKVKTNGYSASIDSSKAQVMANQAEKQYVLGPYKLNYDDIQNVSYVKDLIIEYGQNQQLLYGICDDKTEHKDFFLVLDGNSGTNSNGMKNEYPKSGQSFFIVLDANKIGLDTKSIVLNAHFEYVENSNAHYETLLAKANAYRYSAHCHVNQGTCDICEGNHDMKHAVIQVLVTYQKCSRVEEHVIYGTKDEQYETNTVSVSASNIGDKRYDGQGRLVYEVVSDGNGGGKGIYYGYRQVTDYSKIIRQWWTTENETETYISDTLDVYIPYLQMTEKIWHTQDGQELTLITDGLTEDDLSNNAYREYKVVEARTPITIDLTMEIGGMVWVDDNGGKEDVANGIYDNGETKVSNLIVRLHKENDEPFEDGVTTQLQVRTDSDGKYVFKDRIPMYKYYVTFEYNGQYYEPTNYTSPYDNTNGWGKGNWEINSNAVDQKSSRENYNNTFATINSCPSNYGTNKRTYTKMELLGYTLNGDGSYSPTPVFDDKGNVLPASTGSTIDQFGNIINTGTSMYRYADDCMMTAYTMNPDSGAYDYYPTPDIFVIDTQLNRVGSRNGISSGNSVYNLIDRTIMAQTGRQSYVAATVAKPEPEFCLYPTAKYINLGLHPRQEVDIAVKNDVDKVTVEINNHTHEYTYDTLDSFRCNECGHTGKNSELKYSMDNNYRWALHCPYCDGTDIEANWDISVRLSDGYYTKAYSRGIYKSDYIYKVSAYGYGRTLEDGTQVTTPEQAREIAESLYGKTQEDELQVYVTYKVRVSNESLSINTRIDELVDYYDNTYELVADRSYIEIEQGDNKGKYSIVLDDASACGPTNSIGNYDRVFVRGIGKSDTNGIYLTGGQSACFYLTFKVEKQELNGEEWLELGRKGNLVELNGYSTKYERGTTVPNIGDVSGKAAGIVDMNSTPGNQTSRDDIRENDTDKAPSINIHLYTEDLQNRVISGTVWEDERTKELQATTIGNGTLDDGETLINGVTVQLVELMENGTEFIWREFGSDITGMNGTGALSKGTEGDGTGSGMKDSETPIINAVDENGDPFIEDYVFEADNHDGQYAFKSFMPGNYVVRFKYGDTVRTALPQGLEVSGVTTDTLKGLNAKSYNGQDYKTTTYQTGIEQNKTYVWEQAPVKIVDDNGTYRLWQGSTDTISNWEYGYIINNGTEYVLTPAWDEVGQRVVAPKLTEVSTFKQDASNNETVTLPKIEEVTEESLDTPVIDVDNQNGYLYDITKSDVAANVSDAKDIESRRNVVNDYSDNDVTNYIAEVLASHKADYKPTNDDRDTLVQDLITNTQMTAQTGLIVVEFEYDDTDTDVKIDPENKRQGNNQILNVNLGLEERPKAQLEIEKEITNVKLTLADSSILFDAKQSASNVLWNDHKDYKTGYQGNFMDPDKFGNIENIRTRNIAKFGLVQLTMDEELMHGATIKIDYKVTIKNVGEVDYYETYELDGKQLNRQNRLFYYTGEVTDDAKVVTTSAEEVMDYVANNLQFNLADNNVENSNAWQEKSNDKIAEEGLVNTKLISNKTIDLYNTKIFTESLNAELVPEIYKDKVNKDSVDSTSIPLVLTQLVTSENDTDDLTYRNMVEIVRTSNKVGRRMAFTVVGNQNPVDAPAEMDTDLSETVRILPPFGGTPAYMIYIPIIITIAAAGILMMTIIFIVQKKKK